MDRGSSSGRIDSAVARCRRRSAAATPSADGDSDSYFELYDAVTSEAFGGQPKHQLLGYSNNVQGEMQLECQLVFNSL